MSKNYGNDSQLAEIVKYISDTMKLPLIGAGGGFAPLGMYGFSCDYVLTPPQGWLFADGSIYNIADYPEYAALLASQHGRANIYGGDGVTTFATKDLRGEFIRGWGQNSHENQGDGGEVGEHQDGTEHTSLGTGSGGTFIYSAVVSNGQAAKDAGNKDSVKNLNRGAWQNRAGGDAYDSIVPDTFTSRPTNTSVAFLVKVTLSDAEINAFNVYTPREHQVAWWEEEIDGVWKRKPVYEVTKRIYNTVAWATNTELSLGISNVDNIFIVHGTFYDNNSGTSLYSPTLLYLQGASTQATLQVGLSTTNKGKLKIQASTTFGASSDRYIEVTVRYTKTTDDWQTS